MAGDDRTLLALLIAFAPLSLVSIGGGPSVFAEMQQQAVLHGWTTAKEFADLYRAKYNKPPDAYAAIAYIAYSEMFRGFEAAKSYDPHKVSAAVLANKGQFNSIKGPARWREDHGAEYKYAAFLVKGKGAKEQKNEWDLFTVMGGVGGEAVLPTLKSLGY